MVYYKNGLVYAYWLPLDFIIVGVCLYFLNNLLRSRLIKFRKKIRITSLISNIKKHRVKAVWCVSITYGLGTNSIINHYYLVYIWHWKHLGIWQGNATQFNESSTYLMGWLRDYLWLGSSQLINGYNPFGMNSLSVWSWVFLAGHLVWAKF